MPVTGAVASLRRAGIARDSHHTTGLSVVVARLLTVALDISEGWAPAPPAATLLIPSGYRDWPNLTSTVESHPVSQRLRFYVCPKALLTPDDESFPVGTAFVVEFRPCSLRTGSYGFRPSVFVMEKCIGLTMNGVGTRQYESWIYASWDSAGHHATADSGRCGVCRLPWLTPADIR